MNLLVRIKKWWQEELFKMIVHQMNGKRTKRQVIWKNNQHNKNQLSLWKKKFLSEMKKLEKWNES